MEFLWEGLWVAGRLILRADPEVVSTAATSLYVAAWSTVGAALFGLPVGYLLAVREFRGRETAVTVVNALLGLPTVVVGLVAYAFLSRRGLLGGLGLLFTPAGVILGLGWMFSQALIVDRNMGPIEAMQASWNLTRGEKGGLLLWMLVCAGICLLGAMACGVGLFVAAPICGLGTLLIYEDLLDREVA